MLGFPEQLTFRFKFFTKILLKNKKMKNKKDELSVLRSVHFLFVEEAFNIKYNKIINTRNLQELL